MFKKAYICATYTLLLWWWRSFPKQFLAEIVCDGSLFNLWPWYPRNVHLHGRMVILKIQAVSKLFFNTAVLTVRPNFIQKVNNAIAQSVWQKKATNKANYNHWPKSKRWSRNAWILQNKQSSQSNLDKQSRRPLPFRRAGHTFLFLLKQVGGLFLLKCNLILNILLWKFPLSFVIKGCWMANSKFVYSDLYRGDAWWHYIYGTIPSDHQDKWLLNVL